MIRFKSVAFPGPSKGLVITDVKQVQPDQSMSLEEILTRFTRNEALPIGKETFYDDDDSMSDIDLEKVTSMDLVDKQELADKLEETKLKYDAQEKRKAAAAAKRAHDEAVKLAAEQLKKEAPDDKAK